MKIKNFTLLCFFSIAFSQISVNELRKFSNSDLDKIRQQLEVETEDRKDLEIVDTELSSEMSEISIVKNSYSNVESKYFGYNYFNQEISFFDNIPTPADFKIGPGDELKVQLFGSVDSNRIVPVNREGNIVIPQVGSIEISGLVFREAIDKINSVINASLIGVSAEISLAKIRSIQVFVLGNAYSPGAYTVSSLSNVSNILFFSGGPTKNGSLRNIEIKRFSRFQLGELVKTEDNS